MKSKITLFVASLLMCASAFAQWTKPADPASIPLKVGQECYLFNTLADGFLVGANDWGTRASVSPTLGHKVVIEEGTAEGSYYLTNYVLSGWMANQMGYMFIEPDNFDAIYVDNTKDGKTNNQFTFEPQTDGTYLIGLSPKNANYVPDLYPGAYLGINTSKVADTRLYFCLPENNEDYTIDQCQLIWIFVAPESYEAYVYATKQYEAAMALGSVIEEAKTLGVDASDAEKVYADTNSTPEQLAAAKETLAASVQAANFAAATVEKPFTVAFFDFENKDASAWTSQTSAQNKGADNGNNAADYSKTGIHYENWHPSNFSVGGKIYASVKNAPKGVYHLSALAFTNSGQGVSLFAGNSKAQVTATNIDLEKPTDVYTFLLDDNQELQFGLDVEAMKAGWVGLDNVKLEYLGASVEAYQVVLDYVLKTSPDYDDNTYCQKSLYEAYASARQAIEAAKEPADMAAAISAFEKACEELTPSVEAYADYAAKVEEARAWIYTVTGDNEDIDLLSDYLDAEEEPAEGVYNGNGTATTILLNGLLDAKQIAAEAEYLQKIWMAAMAAGMVDGDDCTDLLKNPNFTEEGGWTAAMGITWPEGTDAFKVFQAWGRVADVHQELKGLQNGIYEMDLQAVYHPDGDADIHQNYAYINDFQTKIPLTTEEAECASAEDASAQFAAGTYPVKVYGLVADNNMRIGIANRLRTGENGILWAGGVKLTFRARNAEACAEMTKALVEQANALKANYCGQKESEVLAAAIAASEAAVGTEGAYNALKALKVAIDAVVEGTETYKSLAVAIEGLDEAIKNNKTADAATIADAQAILDDARAAYDAKTLDNAAAAQAVEDVNAAAVAVKMGKSSASEENPVDYTDVIINNNFDPAKGDKNEKRIDGWVVEGALNGYKSYSCSFNKGTFDLHQDLAGLPKGKYKVTVHTYYRAGSYEEEGANISAGKDTHLMKLYANTSEDSYETSIMNLSEGSKDVTLPADIKTNQINGITVPDGTGPSVACFEAGLFLNELSFLVGEDGKATIGLKLSETIGTNDYTVVGAWNLLYMGEPSGDMTEQDVSTLIVNNTFDPAKGDKNEKRIDGWVVEGALNGYKSNTCSFNKGTFDLHQDLSGLPEGTYQVTVHTFYRAGSYEEEGANIAAGKDTHLMKLYANTSEDSYVTSIMNLSEGSKDVTLPADIKTNQINGITVPDGTGPSVACFEAGLFLNKLPFYVGADGKATIGLKLSETIGTNDYTVVGEWNLYYYGSGNSIDKIGGDDTAIRLAETDAPAVPVAFYSLSGAKLSAPQKGVNVVRLSNGKSFKLIVK